MQPLLEIKNLSVAFNAGGTITQAVKEVSLTVKQGEIVALVGESGSGKSVTSLSILQLLPSPPAVYMGGEIIFHDKAKPLSLLQLSAKELQHIRGNHIAMIFQEPMTSLNPVITCGKQVMEALLIHKPLPAAEAKKITIEWFKKVKLPQPEELFNRYPHQLSGGQKQRVMIAMAMICQPSLLICDEPTTALDVTVQKTILELIKELQQQQNMGVIFITHDLGVVAQIADSAAIMYKGQVIEQNKVHQLFKHPQQPYTKALLACRPALHPKGEKLPVVSDFLEATGIQQPTINSAFINNIKQQEVLVTVENLSVQYPVKTTLLGKPIKVFTAVNNVSFTIYKGETVGLVGESGCGKSTLGRTLLGLSKPSEGQIIINHQDITHLNQQQLKKLRQQVQLVFQDPFSSLNPRLTIGAAIEEPIKLFKKVGDATSIRNKVAQLLDQVGLPLKFASRYPHEFSGGQRQRIVIARALALNPAFLVCDESVSALDVSVQAQVLNLLNSLKQSLGLTLLFISHDLSVVRYMSDRILVMHKGEIVESGSAEGVYNNPETPYTQNLLAAIPSI